MSAGRCSSSISVAIAASASESARRRRSSRSFRLENAAVTIATIQNAVTLKTGSEPSPEPISGTTPGALSRAGISSAACAYRTTIDTSECQSAIFRPVR